MPRYQDIARQLKTAIEQGELKPGARLPSSRTWSQELGVSRSTVENAYAELVAQGWLIRRGQAGTFVSERIYPQQSTVQVVAFAGESQQPLPFQMGLPALDLFPRELWARVMGRRLRTQTRFDLALGDVCGEAALREAIVDYLRVSRGIDCQPEQVFITHGYAASIALILHALAKPGNGMWIEDPGFPLIRPIVTRHDVEILPVPVDDNGLDITSGIQNYPDARFALITPAHQSPLGVALSLARRHQILEWADRSQAWIIEDDYDSELRLNGQPIPALQSIDVSEKVIYINTFTKTLSSTVRISYMVLPEKLLEKFYRTLFFYSCTVSNFEQYTLAKFIDEGCFEKHINRMRKYYTEKKKKFLTAIKKSKLNKYVTVHEEDAGLQFLMEIKTKYTDEEFVKRANKLGIKMSPLSGFYHLEENKSERMFVMNYLGVEENNIEKVVEKLSTIV